MARSRVVSVAVLGVAVVVGVVLLQIVDDEHQRTRLRPTSTTSTTRG
jgi:hypothetical protein